MSTPDYIKPVPKIPGKPTSVWLDTTDAVELPIFKGEDEADVVVIGGGLAGVLTAYLLAIAKLDVILIEAGDLAADVTGHTTAKVTSQHGLIYSYLTKKFNLETAKLYGTANEDGLSFIREIIEEYGLKCDFHTVPSYVYAENLESRKAIIDEVNICDKINVPVDFVSNAPLPFENYGAAVFDNQAQFHPRKFVLELLPHLIGLGVRVYQNSRVREYHDGDVCETLTDNGRIISKKAVITTHYPIYDSGKYYTKLYPHRSYVLAAKVEGDVPVGNFYTINGSNYFSFRSQRIGAGKVLLFSGERHYAGRDRDYLESYRNLNRKIKENFQIKEIVYHWSTQDNLTPDRLPYIGLSPKSKNTYIATGFNGWGMTTSAVAAMINSNLILGKEDRFAKIFDPNRFGTESWPEYTREAVRTFFHVFSDRFKKHRFRLVTDIPPGEAEILEVKNKSVGVYKDEKGNLTGLVPKCTHMGCGLHWNDSEKTWDCHCHGSRFKPDGTVIHGPAKKELNKEDVEFNN